MWIPRGSHHGLDILHVPLAMHCNRRDCNIIDIPPFGMTFQTTFIIAESCISNRVGSHEKKKKTQQV